jgi:cytochrome c
MARGQFGRCIVKRSLLFAFASLGVFAAGNVRAATCPLPADAEAGKSASIQCRACHVFEADTPSRLTGPNLHDAYGSVAGGRSDFAKYSEGMIGARDKKLVWTDEALFDYIGDPKAFLDKVNGREVKHSMLFQLSDSQKRKDVIAFLKAIKGKPECD